MASQNTPELIKLSDTEFDLKDPNQDIRDRHVVDRQGDEVGDVKNLIVDKDEHRVRFLLVGSGGFLGIGEDTIMVPVDSITGIDTDTVHVDLDRDHVAKGPKYDPSMITEDDYWNAAYDHYGYLPFWSPGYRAPAWPGMP